MNGNEKLERDLEFFLREDDSRVAVLYRKLPRAEPDAKIDAAVLAMARRTASPSTHARNRRWVPALSAAAAILLAASVAIRVGPQIWNSHNPPAASQRDEQISTVRTQEPPTPPALASPPAPPAMASPPPMPAQSAPPARQMTRLPMRAAKAIMQDVPAQPAQPAQRFDLEKSRPAAPAAAAMPTTSPQSMLQESSAGHVDKDLRNDSKSQSAPPVQPAPAVAFPATATVSQSNESAKQDAGTATQKQERQQADSTTESAVSNGAAVVRAAPTANAQAPAESMAPLPTLKRSRPLTADAQARLIHNSQLYPESWIAAIRRIIRDGHDDEARANLDYFTKKYPDYRLPDDLDRFTRRTK